MSEPKTADPSGTQPAPMGEDELGKAKADNLRLKQEIANLRGVQAKAAPVVTAVMKLATSGDEGRAIVEKLLRGESLSLKQEEKAEEAVKKYLTAEDLERVIPQIAEILEERIYIADSAREGKKELDDWASKEFEGYDGLKGSPAWKRKVAKNVDELGEGVESGLYEIPAKYKGDLFKWAIAQTFAQVKEDNPQLGKKVKAQKSPEEMEAEKLKVSSRSSGSSGKDEELPEDIREEVLSIRRLGSGRTVGKSFSQRPFVGARR